MDCLSAEQLAAYLRGGRDGDARAVEAHVRDCPGCAIALLLAREALPAQRAATRKFVLRRRSNWLPWAAAAILVAAVTVALLLPGNPPPREVVKPPVPKPAPKAAPEEPRPVVVEAPKPAPAPAPKPETPLATPGPKLEPKPAPRPEPKSETPVVKPQPAPEPKKPEPAPTVVEKFAVARVAHSTGGAPAGKTYFAGDTVATAKQEFLALALDGYGMLYVRENTKAEIDIEGALTLHEGEILGHVDSGRRMAPMKTPAGEIQLQAELFDVQATKAGVEVSVVEGRAAQGQFSVKGPSMLFARPGKAAESRPLEAGFAGWVPDKIASKRFAAWFEGEAFAPLAGFRAMEFEGASRSQAAVQTAEQGTAVLRAALPVRARQVLWLRVRQYPGKAVTVGLQVNGQSAGTVSLEGQEGKPWRWVGPVAFTSDRLDLAVAALSRFPLAAEERRSFPVVVDAVAVSTDLKFVPAERVPEELRPYALDLGEPVK
jgi:hypothetical protein